MGSEESLEILPKPRCPNAMSENLSEIHIFLLDSKIQQVRITLFESSSSVAFINNIMEDSRGLALSFQAKRMGMALFSELLQYPEQLS